MNNSIECAICLAVYLSSLRAVSHFVVVVLLHTKMENEKEQLSRCDDKSIADKHQAIEGASYSRSDQTFTKRK